MLVVFVVFAVELRNHVSNSADSRPGRGLTKSKTDTSIML